MFILGYVNATLMALLYLSASIFGSYLWYILISGSIFALLYTNLIIMCKYMAVFIKKTVKKELLTQNEIYFLITSLIIFVVVGVVLTPKDGVTLFTNINLMNIGENFLLSIYGYIFFLLILTIGAVTALFSLEFTYFFGFILVVTLMWINLHILSKYFYRFIRKITPKAPLSQKEIILLVTSLLFLFTMGIVSIPGLKV